MDGARKIGGAYIIAVGFIVAAYFVFNAYVDENDMFDSRLVWNVLNVLMAIGLAVALGLQWLNKQAEREMHAAGSGDMRAFIANNAFIYVTAAITILFFRNWVTLLVLGSDGTAGDLTISIGWVVIDSVLPVLFITTGLRQFRDYVAD